MNIKSTLHVFTLVLILTSCAVFNKKYNYDLINKTIQGSDLFTSHFTGFVLYDPMEKKYLYELNADKYFTPASNTKLFTFYAGLKMLEDSIPSLKYVEKGDSLIFYGTGDPSFLHPDFSDQSAFDFLSSNSKSLFYAPGNFSDEAFGPGWAWDDFSYYFQSERTALPIYGNMVSFSQDSSSGAHLVNPPFFENFVDIDTTAGNAYSGLRHLDFNIFRYQPDTTRSAYKSRIPFRTSDELAVRLLEDTLKRPIGFAALNDSIPAATLYGGTTKELYTLMLKRSDNFLAEQILYLCASMLGDTLNSNAFRNYFIRTHLSDLAPAPIWRDGSGLSRYNLFSPRSLVQLLEKIMKEVPRDELFTYFPAGGQDGTLKNWYGSGEDDPYVFAKTGTLSNNHSLSGYIKTNTNKVLIFSFMNNNYGSSSRPVRKEMEETLRVIKERY